MYVDKLDVLVLAGLLAIIGVIAYFLIQTPPAASLCPQTELAAQLDCHVALANASGLSVCTDSSLPDACAGLYAYRHGTLDACGSWSDPQACQYFYYSARLQDRGVNQSQGIAACRTLTNATWRFNCLDRHAQILKDATFCYEMDVDYYRDSCLDQVSRFS